MKFIALKTKDGELKGDIALFCRTLHVSRQGFYQYLANKDRPWKYQPLADAMKEILTEDEFNVILSRLVDTFFSRILYPMLLLSGNHSIAVV